MQSMFEQTWSRRKLLQRTLGVAGLALLASACAPAAPAPTATTSTQGGAAATTPSAAATQAAPAASTKADYLNTSGELPIANSLITMTMVTTRQANGGKVEGMWYFEFMEKKANIKFEATRIEVPARAEKINVMFAADQLPDVFLHAGFNTNEIVQFGMQEKQLMPLNELIEAYAPNVTKTFGEMPEVKAGVTCPDGKIYNLPAVFNPPLSEAIQRPFIHYSWLTELGLKDPETLDELYDVLKAFKEKDPNGNGQADEIPLGGAWTTGYNERGLILSALGFVTGGTLNKNNFSTAMKDGTPVIAEVHPHYAEYLKYMNKLYSEGLVDKDTFTLDEVQTRAKGSQGVFGLFLDGAPFVMDPQRYTEYEAFIPVTSQWNDKKVWGGPSSMSPGAFLLSSKCKYPEAAIRVADLYFTDKYSFMFWSGPKKGSEEALGHAGWFIEDGQIHYDYANGITNNWDHVNTLNPISGYQVGFNGNGRAYLEKVEGVTLTQNPQETAWRESLEERLVPHFAPLYPNAIYLDPAASERLKELTIPIAEYASTMEAKFITGAEPVTDENLNRYFEEMKKLGAEEYQKIVQDAYEVYAKNL